MSYWGYVMDAMLREDREATNRRRRQRARNRREREDAVLAAARRTVDGARGHRR
jgi:hypothetical protein